ncbi:hypothetical protein ACS0ON_001165 [Cronobacter dublinensis]
MNAIVSLTLLWLMRGYLLAGSGFNHAGLAIQKRRMKSAAPAVNKASHNL